MVNYFQIYPSLSAVTNVSAFREQTIVVTDSLSLDVAVNRVVEAGQISGSVRVPIFIF